MAFEEKSGSTICSSESTEPSVALPYTTRSPSSFFSNLVIGNDRYVSSLVLVSVAATELLQVKGGARWLPAKGRPLPTAQTLYTPKFELPTRNQSEAHTHSR